MKKLHLVFILTYIGVAFISAHDILAESLRDTWIWAIIILIGIVISIYSHTKLLINKSQIEGEKLFLWLSLVALLVPIIGILFVREVVGCHGSGGLDCMFDLIAVLIAGCVVWIVTIIKGLVSVLRNKVINLPQSI